MAVVFVFLKYLSLEISTPNINFQCFSYQTIQNIAQRLGSSISAHNSEKPFWLSES
jgi:hypothetical protein